ncbi:MAG: nucleotidyltransferase family protein [Sphingomonadaceae bacterium]
MTGFALGPQRLAVIRQILVPFADQIDRVALFGSHAAGMARDNSDIDLVIYGAISEEAIDRLWTLFDDSDLSVKVDVVAYGDHLYPPLKAHIDGSSRQIFTKADLT